MQSLGSFLSLFLFFGVYLVTSRVDLASVALLLGFGVDVLLSLWRKKPISPIQKLSLGISVPLVLLSLIFHNPNLLQAKTTIIDLLLTLVIAFWPLFKKRTLFESLGEMSGTALSRKEGVALSFVWGALSLFLALLNLYFWRFESVASWVSFKFFGTLGVSLLGALLTGAILFYFRRGKAQEDTDGTPPVA